MTVTVTTIQAGPHYPNGEAKTFPFGFKAMRDTDIAVFQGVPGTWSRVSETLFSIVRSDEGGSVVFLSAPEESSGPIYIRLEPEFRQEDAFSGGSAPFSPETLNGSMDASALRDLYLLDGFSRALLFPQGIAAPAVQKPIADGVIPRLSGGVITWIAFDETTLSAAVASAAGYAEAAASAADISSAEAAVAAAAAGAAGGYASTAAASAEAAEAAMSGKIDISQKGVPDGVASLGSDGKVPSAQLPEASNLVTSVSGKTGAVTLTPSDVGLGAVDNVPDMDKPVSTATAAAIAAGRLLPVASSPEGGFAVAGAATETSYRYTGAGGHTATIGNTLAIGAIVTIYHDGSGGQITIAPGSGVTLVNVSTGAVGAFDLPQYAAVTLHKVAAGRVLAAQSRVA